MTLAQAFGRRLAQERRRKAYFEERDVTQRTVAQAVGLTSAAISKYEAGETIPNDTILAKLAAFYEVRPGWLRLGEGEREVIPTATVDVVAGAHPRPSRAVASPTKRQKGAR